MYQEMGESGFITASGHLWYSGQLFVNLNEGFLSNKKVDTLGIATTSGAGK